MLWNGYEQERRVLVQADAVRYLQRKEEERDNAKSTLDRNTVKKAIEHLREVGECTYALCHEWVLPPLFFLDVTTC